MTRYYINGWKYGQTYFMSFGWTQNEYDRMMNGETITRNDNEFWIETEER